MGTSTKNSKLLTADWSNMAVMNFETAPELLIPYLPGGLELARFSDVCLLSMVGFQFANTRMGRIPVPFYGRFIEVYLGFFARRIVTGTERRGWVFIRKVVPSRAVATVGGALYNEDYIRRPMREEIVPCSTAQTGICSVSYQWHNRGRWNGMSVHAESAQGRIPEPDSVAAYFCDSYGGFAEKRGGGSIEFPVTHPGWKVWPGTSAELDCDVGEIFGRSFEVPLASPPHSTFVVSGSTVSLGKAIAI